MQQILQLLTISTSVLLGILSLGGFLGEYDWRLDLISHFRLQFLLFFLIILILSLVLKSKITLYLALFFIITNGLPFLSFYLPITAQSDKKGLLVLSANVKKDNHEYSRFLELVQRTNPDVIVLQEIDKEWQYSLTSLKKIYPYEVGEVREDYFGIILLSKYKLQNQKIERFGIRDNPTIVTQLTFNNKAVTIIGTHPFPPFNKLGTDLRNTQLKQIAEYVNQQKNPVLLVGDTNASPFSYGYRLLTEKTKLKNCSYGFGYASTWQMQPFVPPLGLRIDHCFYTDPIRVMDSRVTEDIGSDHRPLLNKLAL